MDPINNDPDKTALGHVELLGQVSETNEVARRTSEVLRNQENLSYGESGLKGLIKSPYVFSAAFLASMGGFSFGYDQGVISLILTMPIFHRQFPETEPGHPHQGFNVGFMTGMLELGAFFGCLFFPRLADSISRKKAIVTAVMFFFIGAIIQTAAHNYGTLVAGRAIGGIGVGTLAMGAPLYISEIAPPNLRGNLLVLEQFSIVIGAIVAYWITYGTNDIPNSWCFRLPFLLQMVPAGFVGVGIMFFPYSPRWLAMVSRNDDCLDALCQLRRLPPDDERVQIEYKSILTEVEFQNVIHGREHVGAGHVMREVWEWLDLFRPRWLRRTVIAIGMPFFQQFSGINAFQYYAPTLFATIGMNISEAKILTGMINIFQIIGVTITLFTMDKVGRRRLSIWGAVMMGVPHCIMAGLVAKFNDSWPEHKAIGWFGVAVFYFYMFSYGLTYGPVGWTLPSEVYPNARRSRGVGLATSVNWIANFIIGVCVPPMIQGIGYGTYVFFAAFCGLALLFAYFLVPETAGKTLEQMDEVFHDNSGAEELRIKAEILARLG
ncbi:uncharacterized protein PV07_10380 [Cladophialophora immunda]|uniref:Major facilitator superfamily (MFS) profile domain-containing protein n=1 Tax=Cladophialophora immunda TaxID=569365 RepID=A0A0D2BZZ1_9EURO|nr:uncharacterized protein PV07_10380 [Cladophialophora immunda]KIW24678.1 hypothetical protein PV07_10380 [Cladophialophora immunda]